jgi:hypothetical protein
VAENQPETEGRRDVPPDAFVSVSIAWATEAFVPRRTELWFFEHAL